MSTNLTTYNSSLASDPLRAFRFNATFQAASGGDGVFDNRIKSSGVTSLPKTGVSSGWTGGFTTISGLNVNTQNIAYREGGMNTTVHQIPGMTSFQPITFTRGVLYGNDQAMTWMRGLFSAAQGGGLNDSASQAGSLGFRVDIIITVNEHPNTSVSTDFAQMAFKIHNAWITGLSYSDLDATNGALMFETMTLVHEGLSAFFPQTNPPGATLVGADGTSIDLY